MKTIIGETAIPDGTHFPPSWPHKVLQAAVTLRLAYQKAGRAGGRAMAEIEALSSKMLDTVTADLQEEQGRLTDPFETPVSERTRSAMDEMPSHDALHDHMPEGS
jgi:hypothetical protein